MTSSPRFRHVSGPVLSSLALIVLLSGCAAAVPASAPSAPAVDLPTAMTPDAVEFAPLRGIEVPAGSVARPSLAVKIDNHEDARPQIGLERSDIVFEELVEGGLTRYVGVWHSDIPDLLGPVRSIRPMDPDIISPFGGIVAYSGGAEEFVEMMMIAPVVNSVFDLDDTGLFYRVDDKESPHDVVVKAAELVRRHADLPAPPQLFMYAATGSASSATVKGDPVRAVNVTFSESRWPGWNWDAASQGYLRSQEGAPDLDGNGAQLAATNVLVLSVDIDWRYEDIPKTTMIGSGEAWVCAGGRALHGSWSKDSATAPIVLTAHDGSVVELSPGNTWIELVPVAEGSVELQP